MGRLDGNKNYSLVIKSVGVLNRQNIYCGLLIIGQGEEKAKLLQLAEKENIEDRVFFLGYKKNPFPYLTKAKILCLSSFAEGFPTVVCEAMLLVMMKNCTGS